MKAYRTENSNLHNEFLSKFVPGGVYSNFSHKPDMPIYFKHAQGSRLIDLDNNEYLDMYGGSGAYFLGHNHPLFKERFHAYINQKTNQRADIKSVELLFECVPSAEMIRFCLSGTEAIQNAIRLSRAYTNRNKILRFEGHYHGNADNIMGGIYDEDCFPEPRFNEHDPHYCSGMIPSLVKNQMILLPWNNIELLSNTMRLYGNEIAAVIMEPLSVNAGSIIPKKGFLKEVRLLCERYGSVLIFDEVITGFRVSLGGAQALFGVIPDLTILGKALGGEFPVSAIAGKKDLMQLYTNRSVIHGGTYNGYYVGQCAICATIETLIELVPYEKMLNIVKCMHSDILKCAKEHDIQMIIQGHPSCASFHYTDTEIDSFRKIDNKILFANSILRDSMRSYGVLTASPSRIYPSIVYSEEDLSFLQSRLEDIMKTVKLLLNRVLNSSVLAQPYFQKE